MNYSIDQFEKDVSAMQPRFFDTYVLPGFMLWYAMKSKEMRKNTRRMLFMSGVYMFMRNYTQIKTGFTQLTQKIQELKTGGIS